MEVNKNTESDIGIGLTFISAEIFKTIKDKDLNYEKVSEK